MSPRPGQRTKIYLGGAAVFYRQPRITPTWHEAREDSTARDGSDFIDFLQPEQGWPVVTTKLSLELAWGTMVGADIRTANGILARATEAIDVCTWTEISEAFYFAVGESFSGYLKRRNCLTTITTLPPLAATRYAVAAIRGDGSALTVTLGTPSAKGLTPWTAVGTSLGEYVTIAYTPVYRMACGNGQLSFPQAHVQTQAMSLREL